MSKWWGSAAAVLGASVLCAAASARPAGAVALGPTAAIASPPMSCMPGKAPPARRKARIGALDLHLSAAAGGPGGLHLAFGLSLPLGRDRSAGSAALGTTALREAGCSRDLK